MSEAMTTEPATARSDPSLARTSDAPEAAGRVAELRVSAHLMTLETGLYCVFPTSGSPDPDPITGLPGVRVMPAPGIAGRPEAVSVSTFREDGWLNGTAALVRVTDGQAQILVSVYQNMRGGSAAAPRLQVLRLSKDSDGTASEQETARAGGAAQPAPGLPEPNPEIMLHVQGIGDRGGKIGEWVGIKGGRRWVEGFGLEPAGLSPEDIEYQGVLGRNWLSPWVEGGKYCGSRGMALPMLGLKVRLRGDAAKVFECTYSATFVDGSETGPVSAGEVCEAPSLAPLEALQVLIRARDEGQAETRDARDKSPTMSAKSKAAVRTPGRPVVKSTGRR